MGYNSQIDKIGSWVTSKFSNFIAFQYGPGR